MNIFRNTKGFTLIEVVIVSAVSLILLSFMSVNLFNLPSSANLDSTVNTLVGDIKTQQIKAMAGDTEGRGVPDTYGIYFAPTSYILFHGAAYSANDPDNFSTTPPANYSITTTAPSSTIIFTKGSGEIFNFSNSQNTILVKDTTAGKQKTISFNKYGTITDIH